MYIINLNQDHVSYYYDEFANDVKYHCDYTDIEDNKQNEIDKILNVIVNGLKESYKQTHFTALTNGILKI